MARHFAADAPCRLGGAVQLLYLPAAYVDVERGLEGRRSAVDGVHTTTVTRLVTRAPDAGLARPAMMLGACLFLVPDLIVMAIGLALGAIIMTLVSVISPRRGLRRAAEAGALWSGIADFEATNAGEAPSVSAAFAGLGALYGSSMLRLGDRRAVRGLLFVAPGRVWWQPRMWLGRGKPTLGPFLGRDS